MSAAVTQLKPEQRGRTAADLYGMVFPPIKWIVEDYIAEGLTVLAGSVAGTLAVTRPILLPLLAFLPVAIFVTTARRDRVRAAMVFGIAGAVVVGAVMTKNWLAVGQWSACSRAASACSAAAASRVAAATTRHHSSASGAVATSRFWGIGRSLTAPAVMAAIDPPEDPSSTVFSLQSVRKENVKSLSVGVSGQWVSGSALGRGGSD